MPCGRRLLVAVLALGCGGRIDPPSASSDASGAADGTSWALAGPRAFVVKVQLEEDAAGPRNNSGLQLPAEDTFSLFIDARGGQPFLIASRTGSVAQVGLLARDGRWTITDPLGLVPGPGQPHACFGFHSITYRNLEIVSDGQGGIRGTLAGGAGYQVGDVVGGVKFTGTFTGVADDQPPTLHVREALPRPHLGDGINVVFSEALPAGTSVRLVGADGVARLLQPGAGALAATFSLAAAIGPMADLRLEVAPALIDLGGNGASANSLALDLVAVPLLPEDGFEGAAKPFLFGHAAMTGGEQAITGKFTLLIPTLTDAGGGASARASWRLAVSAGDTVVRATVRGALLAQPDLPGQLLTLPIKAISATGAATGLARIVIAEPLTNLPGTSIWLSAPQTLELPLPPGTTDQVLIDVNQTVFTCGGPSPTVPGALLDDVRVE